MPENVLDKEEKQEEGKKKKMLDTSFLSVFQDVFRSLLPWLLELKTAQ